MRGSGGGGGGGGGGGCGGGVLVERGRASKMVKRDKF